MSPIGSAKTSLGGGLRALGLCGDGARGHHEPAGEHGRHGPAEESVLVRLSHVSHLLVLSGFGARAAPWSNRGAFVAKL